MTLEEANKLVSDIALGLIPLEHRWQGTGGTLKVQGGWARLGDAGIRAARSMQVLRDGRDLTWVVEVKVDDTWYWLDTEEKETNE